MIKITDYNKIKTELSDFKSAEAILKIQLEVFDEESENLKVAVYEPDMPVTFSNHFNSKTENIACKRESYEWKIKMLQMRIAELSGKLNYIDNILNQLDSDKRHIAIKKYIENVKYKQAIIESLKSVIGFTISEASYKRKIKSISKFLTKYNLL